MRNPLFRLAPHSLDYVFICSDKFCESLDARIMAFMDKLAGIPSHVVSYFLHPKVQYSATIDL